jgi:glycine hydroxymethyltransferase
MSARKREFMLKTTIKEDKSMEFLDSYFFKTPKENRNSAVIAYLASLDHLQEAHPEIARSIVQEIKDQRKYLKLIASENYSSLSTQLAMGNLLTDKYSEGIVNKRFYAGCENVDSIESLAAQELKELFGCEHAYVQPHSGADANLVAFWAILMARVQNKEIEALGKKNITDLTDEEHEKVRQLVVNQKLMGMSLSSGGHLTHGYRMNVSSKIFQSVSYHVNPTTEKLDYAELLKQVKEEKPAILIGGYSAYPRLLNFAKLREIADSVGATLMGDIAHFAGLVAGGMMTGEYNPVPYCDIISSTTHKTLRGPRGGIVMCKQAYQDYVDKGCPIVLGGPLPHVIAAKAIAFKEAKTAAFKSYAHQVLKNAAAMADEFLKHKVKLFSGGTENHLVVVNVQESFQLNGRQAESLLRSAHITANRNMVPFDKNGPWYTSGIRLGSPAMTTLGMKEDEMRLIARSIVATLRSAEGAELNKSVVSGDEKILKRVREDVKELLGRFPLYPELLID